MTEKMSLKREIEKEYFEWLVQMVDGEEDVDLLYELDMYDFQPIIEMDKNRCADGLELRRLFGIDYGYEDFDMDKDCSVLEMLVGLAVRMNDLTQEIEEDSKIDRWFWEMISNLEIPKNTNIQRAYINQKIDILTDRTYDFDGSGGLFPLNDPETDQRELELWYQMNQYLAENYFYGE